MERKTKLFGVSVFSALALAALAGAGVNPAVDVNAANTLGKDWYATGSINGSSWGQWQGFTLNETTNRYELELEVTDLSEGKNEFKILNAAAWSGYELNYYSNIDKDGKGWNDYVVKGDDTNFKIPAVGTYTLYYLSEIETYDDATWAFGIEKVEETVSYYFFDETKSLGNAPKAYYWNDDTSASWPGVSTKPVEGVAGLYEAKVPVSAEATNIIFNDGKDVVKTSDLELEGNEGKYLRVSTEEWKDEAPVYTVTVNDEDPTALTFLDGTDIEGQIAQYCLPEARQFEAGDTLVFSLYGEEIAPGATFGPQGAEGNNVEVVEGKFSVKNPVVAGGNLYFKTFSTADVYTVYVTGNNYAKGSLVRYVDQDGQACSREGQFNLEVNPWAVWSDVSWKVNYGNFHKWNGQYAIRLGSYLESWGEADTAFERSINSAEKGDFADIFNDVGSVIPEDWYAQAMVSEQYIENVQDITVYWDHLPENASGRVYLAYKLDTENEWKILLRDDGEDGVGYNNYMINNNFGTGVAGEWNAYMANAGDVFGGEPSATGDFATNLKGKNARIAVISANYAVSVGTYFDISGIAINKAQQAKSYLHVVDKYSGWVCNATKEDGNNYTTALDMIGFHMTQEQADALNVASDLENGKEATFYDQFAYFYNRAFDKTPTVVPSNYHALNNASQDNGIAILLLTTTVGALLVAGAYVSFKKKKLHR